MNTIKLVHTYVENGNVGAYFVTSLNIPTVGQITAMVHFLAEEHIAEDVMLHEDLQAEILIKFFDNKGYLLDECEVKNMEEVIKVDQYLTREDACCDGVTYKHYNDTFKGSTLYTDILQFILDNPTRYDA